MKRVLLIIVLIVNFSFGYCQDWIGLQNDSFTKHFDKLDWSEIELPFGANEKLNLLNESQTNKLFRLKEWIKSDNKYLDCLHFLHLNNDNFPDLIILAPSAVGPILEIFVYHDNNYKSIFESSIENIEIKLDSKTFQKKILFLSLTQVKSSTYSHKSFLKYIIEFENNNSPNVNKLYEISYSDDVIFPEKFNLNIPFSVLNEKYNLRKKPEISDNNVIMLFTSGDKGTALASKEDETGRIWWFVVMENNIEKSLKLEQTYLNKLSLSKKEVETVFGTNEKWFGWISSRFVEIIK